MNLRWKSFERAMRRRVLAEVRASKALRQEYKLTLKARRRRILVRPWVYRLFFPMIALALLLQTGRSITRIIAFICLSALAAAFVRANQLNVALYFSPGLNVFNHLPMSDGQIFQGQWKSWLRNSLWSGFDFFLGYSALAYHVGNRLDSAVAGALMGFLQWIFVVATAACLLLWWPRRLLYLAMIFFTGCATALLIFGWTQTALVNWLGGFAFWIPPLGWILFAMGISTSAGLLHDAWPSVAAGLVLVGFPVAYRKIRRDYVLQEGQFAAARKASGRGEAAASPWQEYVDQFTDNPVDVESDVRSRRFLLRLDWRGIGWIERLVACPLTDRERDIAEFLVAANPKWTRQFRGFLISAAVLFLVARFLIAHSGLDPTFPLLMVVYILIAQSAGNWRGFATLSATGPQPPLYSFLPIGFWELFRAVLKINTMRYVLSLPVVGLVVLLAANSFDVSLAMAGLYGWRILLLGFLAQVILAVAPISAASNDTNRFVFAAAAVAFVLAALGIGGAFVFVTSPALMIAALVTLCAFLAAGVALYARRFNRSQFDLVPMASTMPGSLH